MRAQARLDTGPELALRRKLHALGLRYSLQTRPEPDLRRTVDVVFRSARVAVEVRGCFWHACPKHGSAPKTHAEWWMEKFRRNKARDRETVRWLTARGWKVIVVWEHDDPGRSARLIQRAVAAGRGKGLSEALRGREPEG
jgi:DNA mismatch endonuclease (patch repair protein)